MPGLDRLIDPATRDYVPDGFGATKKTTSLATQLWHQFMGKLNGWVGDSTAGSLMYKLERARNSKREIERAADYVRQAAKPLIDAGLAADLVINITRDPLGSWIIYTTIRDLQSGAIIDLNPLLPYGA